MASSATYKKLYRSQTNRVIFGILGGLGEYLNVDPVILRFGWLFVTIFSGFVPGLIVYILGLLIIPEKGNK